MYRLSNKSVIRTFRPLAMDSIVSILGILPLQISSSVDFGIPVSKAAWRSVKFLLYMGGEKTLSERIKELRKVLGLSREEFANRLGLKSRGKIENIELGRTSPDEPFLDLICATFNLNPDWLRTGRGEMFIELSKDEQIKEFIEELLSNEEDSFKRRLISGLAALDENGWSVLESFLDSVQTKKG